MNKYFKLTEKVFDVTERYPQLLDLFVAKGFENLRNETLRKTIGKTISVENALKTKKIDPELFEKEMIERIENRRWNFGDGLTEAKIKSETAIGSIEGVLPCPVKLQLLEKFENFLESQKIDLNVDLRSASLGLEHIAEKVRNSESEDDLADIYMSAGFNLFFDKKLIGKYMEQDVFRDMSGFEHINPDFENAAIDLRDPLRRYSIIAVVPAVLLVNKTLLGGRPYPKRWADILKPEFRNSVSLPVKDLDMFNAVMLGIYKLYGFEGIRKLGRNLLEGMHPAQMVKGAKSSRGTAPAVSVVPYFFAQMAKEGGSLEIVWPEEGAIISPIFLIAKAGARERMKPILDFLYSKEIGETIHVGGKFPSTLPFLDNRLGKEQKFVWIGWDTIHSQDIGRLLHDAEEAFSDKPR